MRCVFRPAIIGKALKGGRVGQHGIRINVNDQGRICFRRTEAGAEDVPIVDYHWGKMMVEGLSPPIHPGEVLVENFIEGFGNAQNELVASIGVPPPRIAEIVHGKRAITADTALRLGRYQFRPNPQTRYELECAEGRIAAQIAASTPLQVA